MATTSPRESIAPNEGDLHGLQGQTGLRQSVARLLNWPLLHKAVCLVGDLLSITLAHMIAFRVVIHLIGVPADAVNPDEYHRYYIPFFAVVLCLFDGYKSPELRRPEHELERSCKAVGASFLALVLFNFVLFRSEPFSRYLLVSWFTLATILVVGTRFSLRGLYQRLWKAGLCRRRTLLIGSTLGLARYRELISIQRHEGCDLVGVLLDAEKPQELSEALTDFPLVGFQNQWEECLASADVDVVIVAYPITTDMSHWLNRLLERCKQLGVEVELYSGLFDTSSMNHEHDEYAGCFRFFGNPLWSIRFQQLVKRVLDVLIGLVGSAVTLLLTPIIGSIIKLEDGGPIFYRSSYVGPNGEDRYYLKFRTMMVDADRIMKENQELRKQFEKQYKLTRDPRVTRIGRFLRKSSLDELPSFFSILHGDISLVGPRTIMQVQRDRYGIWLPKLLSVKPGLTGFWQVMGRQLTTHEERVQMDMFYIDRWSIWLDLLIIAKTFRTVATGHGAY